MNLREQRCDPGFTRLEAVLIVIVIGVLAAVLLPMLEHARALARFSACSGNIKQLALGYLVWQLESENHSLPFRTKYENGGMQEPGTNSIKIAGIAEFDPTLRSNAWLQFAFLHRQVQNPQLLRCPADRKRKVALSWGSEERGLAAPGMQNDCISYCIGLDAGLNSGGGALDLADAKNQILLSERHMEYDAVNSACSANVGLTRTIKVNRQNGTNALAPLGWKEKNPKLHSRGGSVAMLDGSAHQLYGGQLQELIQEPSDNGELHFIYP